MMKISDITGTVWFGLFLAQVGTAPSSSSFLPDVFTESLLLSAKMAGKNRP
ncbi:MAG: hypothetical protein ABI813_06505 [Bacteroidota bacterium]